MPHGPQAVTAHMACSRAVELRITTPCHARNRPVHVCALHSMRHKPSMRRHTRPTQVWLAPVNAVLPGLGIHVWWYGLWMERAEGLSMNQIAYLGKRDLVEKTIVGLLQVGPGL